MLRIFLWKASCWWQRVRYGVLTVGTPRLKAASESKGISPVIDLVRHHRTGQVYLVEHAPYARVPGASTLYGEPHAGKMKGQIYTACCPNLLSPLIEL
jgi:hypothetical protein